MSKASKFIFLMVLSIFCTVSVQGDELKLKDGYPDRYVVQEGDTLWDIAGKFLEDPWKWPEIWHINPEVKKGEGTRSVSNPHLIYPGDVLALVNGKLQVIPDEQANDEVAEDSTTEVEVVEAKKRTFSDQNDTPKIVQPKIKLLPVAKGQRQIKLRARARPESHKDAIPAIPVDAIRQFLSRPTVIPLRELESLPYVVGSVDERLYMGAHERIFVKGLKKKYKYVRRYTIIRQGRKYKNRGGFFNLGLEAIYVGEALLIDRGKPSTFYVETAKREIRKGDRLRPIISDEELSVNFHPKAPKRKIKGRIIAFYDGMTRVGQYQVLVINVGEKHFIQKGHVLAIYQRGRRAKDPKGFGRITLPDQRSGLAMVFQTHKRVSYALVMNALSEIKLYDSVRNP